jgi:hypothetical protein
MRRSTADMMRASLDRIADRTSVTLEAFNRAIDPFGSAPTDPALQHEVDALLRPVLARDFARVKRKFDENDEYVFVEEGLPAEIVARIRAEVVVSRATRSVAPWHRAAGSIGYRQIQREAPFTAAFYRSAVLREYVSALSGKPIQCRRDDDDHACTFYVYSKPGDRMAYHYDVCGCEDGVSYSLIVGVINNCSQKLLVKLRRDEQPLRLSTPPGTLVTFSGSKLLHGVSRLGRKRPTRRLVKVMADTFLHFGVGGLVKRVRERVRAAAR